MARRKFESILNQLNVIRETKYINNNLSMFKTHKTNKQTPHHQKFIYSYIHIV